MLPYLTALSVGGETALAACGDNCRKSRQLFEEKGASG